MFVMTLKYVSEFGFVEPFEEFREELFRITEDVTRTSPSHFPSLNISCLLN